MKSHALKTRPTGRGGYIAIVRIDFQVTTEELAWSMAYQVMADQYPREVALAAAESLTKQEVLSYLKQLLRGDGEEAFQDPAIFGDDDSLRSEFLAIARRKFAREFPGELQES